MAAASLDHKPIKESWVGKYKIPASKHIAFYFFRFLFTKMKENYCSINVNLFSDSYVFYNIYYFHNDPEYWGDPEKFRPERFLEQVDGTTKLVKHERLVPFGFGRRICMGESLAKAELFLFTVLLIQVIIGHT